MGSAPRDKLWIRPCPIEGVSLEFCNGRCPQQLEQESVRPRPYDMRPSARAEKYMCVIVIR